MNVEQLKSDLISLLKSARVFNRLIIAQNENYERNQKAAERTKDNDEAVYYLDKMVKSSEIISDTVEYFEAFSFLDLLDQEDYLLVVNYLFSGKSTSELLEMTNVSTRQGLNKKVKGILYEAYKQKNKSGEC